MLLLNCATNTFPNSIEELVKKEIEYLGRSTIISTLLQEVDRDKSISLDYDKGEYFLVSDYNQQNKIPTDFYIFIGDMERNISLPATEGELYSYYRYVQNISHKMWDKIKCKIELNNIARQIYLAHKNG